MKVEFKFDSRDDFNEIWPVDIQQFFRESEIEAVVVFDAGEPKMRLDAPAEYILRAFMELFYENYQHDNDIVGADDEELIQELESRGRHTVLLADKFI